MTTLTHQLIMAAGQDAGGRAVTIPTSKAADVAQALGGGVVVRVKSHNASRNAQSIAASMRGLLSIKWALYVRHHAADGFYIVTHNDATKLRAQTSRWSRSLSWPVRVPADLDNRYGGIFG